MLLWTITVCFVTLVLCMMNVNKFTEYEKYSFINLRDAFFVLNILPSQQYLIILKLILPFHRKESHKSHIHYSYFFIYDNFSHNHQNRIHSLSRYRIFPNLSSWKEFWWLNLINNLFTLTLCIIKYLSLRVPITKPFQLVVLLSFLQRCAFTHWSDQNGHVLFI